MSESANIEKNLPPQGGLAGMKIRKKLIVLHTLFSVCLGAVLLVAIRPAMSKVVEEAEFDQAVQIAELIAHHAIEPVSKEHIQILTFESDQSQGDLADQILLARQNPGVPVRLASDDFAGGLIRWLPEDDQFQIIRTRSPQARRAIAMVYTLVFLALAASYALVAGALELFVLPKHVYRPIRAILDADRAVHRGDHEQEIVADDEIPADELGSIMRSRNESILALRAKEADLANARHRLEITAADLHKKNHLLETARKNLAGADRLASLGMMSAGIAHELNTPLAVVKGLVDKLHTDQTLSEPETKLLRRVVGRLETLSEGLLDFARVRTPTKSSEDLSQIAAEACALVILDRQDLIKHYAIEIGNLVEPQFMVLCEADRLVQVLVNLVRNAIDALAHAKISHGRVELKARNEVRNGERWVVILIEDTGPGIDPQIIDQLFEPFVSSHLDSHGTGLGLAVAKGIVHEHGGVLVATNKSKPSGGAAGAIFELVLPDDEFARSA